MSADSGTYFRDFTPHAAAVIHQQTRRDGDIFMVEALNPLRHSVFINMKILLLQVGDEWPRRS